MKRTKPTKKQIAVLNKPPHGEYGGHMPNPPKDCKEPKFTGGDGVEYIDNLICTDCRDGCDERKEFKNEWKEYWKRYKGVRESLGLLNEAHNGQDLVV